MAKPIPDDYPRVTPYLFIDGASAAIDFYCSVLGARERMRMPGPDGTVFHAELEVGDSMIMLGEQNPDMDVRGPRAIGAGAKALRPVEDQFYGDRSGRFEDPFGHRWDVATHVEDVPAEEMEKRAAAAMAAT